MRICFSWDDGSLFDLKLMEINKKYNIPAIFFVPNTNVEGLEVISDNQILDSLNCGLFSYGGHTENHTYLSTLSFEQIETSVINNKNYLEKLTNRHILHFCFPGGDYNKRNLKIIKKHFKTFRTADTMNFRRKKSLVKPTIHFFDRGKKSLLFNCLRNFSLREFFIILFNCKKKYFDIIKILIKKSSNSNKDIIIWGHSWELEKYDLWNEYESFIKFVSAEYRDCVVDYDTMLKGLL